MLSCESRGAMWFGISLAWEVPHIFWQARLREVSVLNAGTRQGQDSLASKVRPQLCRLICFSETRNRRQERPWLGSQLQSCAPSKQTSNLQFVHRCFCQGVDLPSCFRGGCAREGQQTGLSKELELQRAVFRDDENDSGGGWPIFCFCTPLPRHGRQLSLPNDCLFSHAGFTLVLWHPMGQFTLQIPFRPNILHGGCAWT